MESVLWISQIKSKKDTGAGREVMLIDRAKKLEQEEK